MAASSRSASCHSPEAQPFQVGDQAWHIHHHVAVEQPGGQLGVADVGSPGVLVIALQVVHHGEVVALALLAVDGEGVGHVDGGLDIGAGIGGDHAPEQRPLQPGRQAAAIQQGAEVVALAASAVEQGGGGVAGGLGVGGMTRRRWRWPAGADAPLPGSPRSRGWRPRSVLPLLP